MERSWRNHWGGNIVTCKLRAKLRGKSTAMEMLEAEPGKQQGDQLGVSKKRKEDSVTTGLQARVRLLRSVGAGLW